MSINTINTAVDSYVSMRMRYIEDDSSGMSTWFNVYSLSLFVRTHTKFVQVRHY